MYYEKELNFLKEVFKKRHISVLDAPLSMKIRDIPYSDINTVLGKALDERATVSELVKDIQENTMYRHTDSFGLSYIYFLLPMQDVPKILLIGPFLPSPLSERDVEKIGLEYNISEKNMRYLTEYYGSIPIIKSDSQFSIMLDTFCEIIWKSPSFKIIDTSYENKIPASPINEELRSENFDDIIVNMKALEKRYDFENEFMKAVSLGQIHKEEQVLSFFNENLLEKRTSDSIRNAKNYCIIMNTLLRKSAEHGGVHPVYLDRVSGDFAVKIELTSSLGEIPMLMRDMFRSYCRLVRRHSLKSFSLVVQKTILLIDSDLSADLTLSSLANIQNISSGYLSTIFRKETGQTVSGYIREKRMKHACHLLSTTRLQVQTVAVRCGIMDMQYFSKIFKRYTGKTPKEYRNQSKIQ